MGKGQTALLRQRRRLPFSCCIKRHECAQCSLPQTILTAGRESRPEMCCAGGQMKIKKEASMNIVTISREFGSGGRELGKRLADLLGYDYYDSEIIAAVARKSGMDVNYVENTLSNHGWKNQSITLRGTLGSSSYIQSSQVALLLEQKRVIEEIAGMGKNCVIVGRNADIILQGYHPFNIFVCASPEAKIRRCRERAPEGEAYTEKELRRKMKQIDEVRSQTREILSGSAWGKRDAYHLTINTTEWDIKELVPAVADFTACFFRRKS